jgi:hypothetical protein
MKDIETDLIWGIKAIAAAVNLTPRQTHYQLTSGLIPAGQQGEKWVASRKVLRDHFARLTSGQAKAGPGAGRREREAAAPTA